MSAATDGRPDLLLLHAFGSSGSAWSETLAGLPPSVETLAPDLPGFGGAADLPQLSVAAYADWVEARAEAAGLARAALVGWSMGGKIALALAARRPAWLAGLALVAPSPASPEPMDEADRETQTHGWGDPDLAQRAVEADWAADTPPEAIQGAVRGRLATSERAWRWWLQSGSREDLDLGPEPLRTPSLVVVGARDDHLGEAAQARLTLPRLDAPRLERVRDCGHFVPLEAPQALARMLGDWSVSL